MVKRFGPLLVAITGTALIVLELFGRRTEDPSVFWLCVGGLAIALGAVGHMQQN
jgi:hypothetical protein